MASGGYMNDTRLIPAAGGAQSGNKTSSETLKPLAEKARAAILQALGGVAV